ncbi:MAG: hypothetical protein AAF368_20380 [Planctomycetota bacterium]
MTGLQHALQTTQRLRQRRLRLDEAAAIAPVRSEIGEGRRGLGVFGAVEYASLTEEINRQFGRRYVLKSFRWLGAGEI